MRFHLDNLPSPELPPLAVAIGVFDGVHKGHQALLAAAKEMATGDALPAALTFNPHPSTVFAPARTPELLGTMEERLTALERYGAEAIIVARFDATFAAQTPDEFIHEILVRRLKTQTVIVGEDFRFGCARTGTVTHLETAGAKFGFTVRIVPPVFVSGTPARSTVIRQLLAGGRVEDAADLLARPYSLSGEVVHGRKLGRTLGFPTANLATTLGILVPVAGVYAGRAHFDTGETVRAAISIGTNPTTTPDATIRTVEAYLMDGFDREIYGEHLALDFLAYLRPTLKFASLDDLIIQMRRDVVEAERLVISNSLV